MRYSSGFEPEKRYNPYSARPRKEVYCFNSFRLSGVIGDRLLQRRGRAATFILKEIQPEESCDPRLRELSVAYWAKVPINNESAGTLISMYLTTDQTVLGFFDATVFIGDLIGQKSRFCTSFLVNALLYSQRKISFLLDHGRR